ncbi:spectrin alpha chain, non-erythrocytic 1-like isoform X2 [Nothobranchius furzeri]|uniref:spectrin alpha chain, non-erythrocytic 1-like isoform X2 n=1 Tax=Nothobranchius furzeri TaxID=105023 RepID=UPI003904CCA4
MKKGDILTLLNSTNKVVLLELASLAECGWRDGSDLEQVDVLQKKFDDFQKDLKANESRLRDINKVASELESEGLMAEEAPMVQAQQQEHLGSAPGKTVRLGIQTTANFNSIKELNNRWCSLQHAGQRP